MAMTLEQFVARLDESGVISAVDIAALQKSQSPPVESAEDLGKLLVKHKKVTRLQAQLVYQGKGDRLLLGNYVILDKIGAGGMGDVYLAEHRRMERRVALKTLPAAMTRDTNSIQRFQREVKAAAKLTHPNIVTAYDADEANGVHYFVMEYVEGVDLSAVVKKRGVLNVDVAVDYILQAAKGLEFAHNKGVIHRDIKPANLLLDNAGTIKILDMGLARIEDEAHEIPATQLTQDGSVMGTVDYMAPEQAKDTHTADARSDIYSLGCSLYYLLTGESVYRGSTMVNRIMAHQNDPIPSLTGKHILISQDVDAVFQKMVAKKPEDRFQSMSEVIVALENCIQMKTSSTVASAPSDPELQKFLQSQKVASSPTVVMSADAMTAEKPLTDTQNESLTSGFLNHTQGGTSFQPLEKRKKSIGKRGWVLMGAVLAPLIFMAGIIFKIDTPAGTIILEVDQPELAGAVVSVDEQKKITIKTGEGTEPIEVVADEKTHTLQVTKGGFETFTKQFTVKAGGKETIKVHLEPLEVAGTKMLSAGPPSESHNGLQFQNRSDYVTLPLKHETAGDLTVEVWVTIDEDCNPPLGYISNGTSEMGFTLGLNSFAENGRQWSAIVANVANKGNRRLQLPSNSMVKSGKRTNITFTYNGNVAQIYVNGHKEFELNSKGSIIHTDQFIIIGNRFPNAANIEYLKGSIDELRFSNIARYTNDFTPENRFENDKNTLALYHFDEGSGDILKDASGNGHDGKIVGARWVKVNEELQVVEPTTTGDSPMTDREIAESVIGKGGVIGSNGNNFYSKVEELPTEPVKFSIISLKNAGLEDDDLAPLANVRTLRVLYLDSNPLHDTGLKYLKGLNQLETLSIPNTEITERGLSQLKELPKLRDLTVASSSITNSGMKAIGDLKQLDTLKIAMNSQIDDTGLGYIAGLTKLEKLYAHIIPRITDEGLKHLKGMKRLSVLTLATTGITDAGLEQLAGFENLSELDITNCKITDSSLEHLKDLKNLKKLGLGLTPVTDLGLQHLHGLKKLESLNLRETKVTAQGIADLQKALPNCKISSDFDSAMTDREVAEWVIGLGGSITTNGISCKQIADLPDEIFEVTHVSLRGLSFKDHELAPLANLNKLKALYLESTSFRDTELQYISELDQLQFLELTKTEVTGAGLCHLEKIPTLLTLDVAGSALTNAGLKAIGKMKQLITLKISFISGIDDTGLGYIADLTKLEKLYLHNNPQLTDEGIKNLQRMHLLHELTLSSTGITDVGLEHLIGMEDLVKLDLANCQRLTDTGFKVLKNFKDLKSLQLFLTPITDAGLKHLHGLKKLEDLDLQQTKVTPQGIAELQKALPNCKIVSDFETKPTATKAP